MNSPGAIFVGEGIEPTPPRVTGNTTRLAGRALVEPSSSTARHAALFERVVPRIHRYFNKLVWDAGEAEDLLQRTLLELERSLREKTYDPARSFNAWMWLKAHTQFAQWARERERRMLPLPEEEPGALSDALARIDDRLDAAAILRVVQERLGDETYEVFVLYYEASLTQAEVAEAVDLDRKTVRKRLETAHRLIDRVLSRDRDRDDEEPEPS